MRNCFHQDPVECVEELLRKANIAESFSQFEAERCYLSILDYREDLLLEENRGLCEKVRKNSFRIKYLEDYSYIVKHVNKAWVLFDFQVLEKVDGFFSSQDSEKARLLGKEYRQYLPSKSYFLFICHILWNHRCTLGINVH